MSPFQLKIQLLYFQTGLLLSSTGGDEDDIQALRFGNLTLLLLFPHLCMIFVSLLFILKNIYTEVAPNFLGSLTSSQIFTFHIMLNWKFFITYLITKNLISWVSLQKIAFVRGGTVLSSTVWCDSVILYIGRRI